MLYFTPLNGHVKIRTKKGCNWGVCEIYHWMKVTGKVELYYADRNVKIKKDCFLERLFLRQSSVEDKTPSLNLIRMKTFIIFNSCQNKHLRRIVS